MAATGKKIMTFNVTEETYNRVTSHFPKTNAPDKAETSENTIVTMLDALERPQVETSEELQAQCDTLKTTNAELTALNAEFKEQLSELTEQLHQSEQDTAKNSEQLQEELRASEEENDRLAAQNAELKEENERLEALVNDMQAQLGDDCKGIADEFTRELLKTVTDRLREQTNTPALTPMQVLLDGFLKYNVQQYNLWFYDFVVSKSEILRMANKYNPQIDSLKKLQKALGIYD